METFLHDMIHMGETKNLLNIHQRDTHIEVFAMCLDIIRKTLLVIGARS